MGSIQRHGEGYRAFVRVDGKKLSKVFTRKALAQDWVAMHEAAKREPKVERAPDETRTLRATGGPMLDAHALRSMA